MIKPSCFLYDSSNIDEYQWPDSEDGKKGRGYLYPLIKNGVTPYLKNVSTKMYLVTCNDAFLPLTVNEKEYNNSYIASNYYALKFYEERFAKKPLLLFLQKPFIFLGGNFLKLFKINKTIFLNNWLMTNSLSPKISTEELKIVVDFLAKKFSSHTIIYRHVDQLLKAELLESLKKNQFHLLKTRDIFFYNPEEKLTRSYTMRKLWRKDLRIMEKHNFERVESEDIQESDYPRMLALYEHLYMDKYTKYSPHYTVEFLKNTHQKKMVHYVALKRNGKIEGFFSYFILNGSMINCLFGYDTTTDYSHDLYKLLTRLVLEEAEKLDLKINDGSGGDAAKIRRGLKPSPEYMGLYSAHLPIPRRFLWNCVASLYKILTPTPK